MDSLFIIIVIVNLSSSRRAPRRPYLMPAHTRDRVPRAPGAIQISWWCRIICCMGAYYMYRGMCYNAIIEELHYYYLPFTASPHLNDACVCETSVLHACLYFEKSRKDKNGEEADVAFLWFAYEKRNRGSPSPTEAPSAHAHRCIEPHRTQGQMVALRRPAEQSPVRSVLIWAWLVIAPPQLPSPLSGDSGSRGTRRTSKIPCLFSLRAVLPPG